MSENKLPNRLEESVKSTDFTEKDKKQIAEYVKRGRPGITVLTSDKMSQMMDLYLSGRTYRQISKVMNVEKALVLYCSDRFNWFDMKLDYLNELELSMRDRLIDAKLISQDFLLQLTHAWEKKIGANLNRYFSTNDERFSNAIDLKEVDKYLKTIEILHRISSAKEAKAAIGLNVGDGVSIQKKGDNSIEITPKTKTLSEMLAKYTDFKEEIDDIKEKEPINEGEGNEK